MSRRLILSFPRVCVFCADPTACHVKVLTVKAESKYSLCCVLCDEHAQASDGQIIGAARTNSERVHETGITGLARNRIEIRENEIQIWG